MKDLNVRIAWLVSCYILWPLIWHLVTSLQPQSQRSNWILSSTSCLQHQDSRKKMTMLASKIEKLIDFVMSLITCAELRCLKVTLTNCVIITIITSVKCSGLLRSVTTDDGQDRRVNIVLSSHWQSGVMCEVWRQRTRVIRLHTLHYTLTHSRHQQPRLDWQEDAGRIWSVLCRQQRREVRSCVRSFCCLGAERCCIINHANLPEQCWSFAWEILVLTIFWSHWARLEHIPSSDENKKILTFLRYLCELKMLCCCVQKHLMILVPAWGRNYLYTVQYLSPT